MATLEERFWAKVTKGPSVDDCWEWTGAKIPDGYGSIGVEGQSQVGAHRVSWELHNVPIPKGLSVLHKCDNPPCTNPKHLFLGTQKDNVKDCLNKDRGNKAKGERQWLAKLTADKVREIRRLYAAGIRQNKIAEMFGVHKVTIGDAVHNKTWKHVR